MAVFSNGEEPTASEQASAPSEEVAPSAQSVAPQPNSAANSKLQNYAGEKEISIDFSDIENEEQEILDFINEEIESEKTNKAKSKTDA